MPTNKNKIKRICAIYSIIRSTPYPPSKHEILERLYDKTGEDVCQSSIEKDLFLLKMDFDIDIRYRRQSKGYYIPNANESTDKLFLNNLFLYLSLHDIPLIDKLLKDVIE